MEELAWRVCIVGRVGAKHLLNNVIDPAREYQLFLAVERQLGARLVLGWELLVLMLRMGTNVPPLRSASACPFPRRRVGTRKVPDAARIRKTRFENQLHSLRRFSTLFVQVLRMNGCLRNDTVFERYS